MSLKQVKYYLMKNSNIIEEKKQMIKKDHVNMIKVKLSELVRKLCKPCWHYRADISEHVRGYLYDADVPRV